MSNFKLNKDLLPNNKILWTNPNPNANMGDTTIQLSDNINNYKYVMIEFLTHKDRNTIFTGIIENYNKKQEIGTVFNYNSLIFVGARLVEVVSNNQMFIENCYGYAQFNTTWDYVNPGWLIPQKIIGVK